jgi:glycosyltransferase involved in cell wall biosynthesis
MTNQTNQTFLSVVVPAHNEQENIPQLVKEVSIALNELNETWELIIVNDASTDNTLSILLSLAKEYRQLKVLSLKQRSGQTAAIDCGLRNANGKYIATLDADLQNDPFDIDRMLNLIISDKCDMVSGWRKERNDPWIRLVSTRIANSVRNWLTNENIHDSASGIKVLKRECISKIKLYNGLHRFLPTLVKMEGYRVNELPVNHRPRQAGIAKYGVLNRVFKALRDAFAIRWMQSRQLNYEMEMDQNINEHA